MSGYLGTALGAIVGALLQQGHTLGEIHEWVDLASRAREFAPEDPRVKEAAMLFTDSVRERAGG